MVDWGYQEKYKAFVELGVGEEFVTFAIENKPMLISGFFDCFP